ncbi:MAG: site-specific DNA-methyltransferase [Sedimentisphaerales bacterium]|nr:site-specific DNA-methyltransferase [Sedimentisphaerales bacterium]
MKDRSKSEKSNHIKEPFGRLDADIALHDKLLKYCRLGHGDIWEDSQSGHRVGVLDATNPEHLYRIISSDKPSLLINDPPYNVVVGNANTSSLSKQALSDYINFSKCWVKNCISVIGENAHFYIWLGADVRDNFQPLPDFMIMMREITELTSRNFITLRNQRGYGTQKNWMWVRQELLYYIKGKPDFTVVYTDIPKILRGYYKEVNGKRTENMERSKSENIRPGNVWVDIQQVFYRMEENVPGCYAQKPLKAIERLVLSSSREGDIILDCFAHSGTTLIAGERLKRRVLTFDVDPVFAEITIRRLEHYRKTGRTGWQYNNPFPEIH